MKKRNTFWIVIGIGILIMILLVLISSILSVGDRLRNIHPYVEYGFYVLSFLLVYFMIINPIRIIIFAPTFSVAAVLENNGKKKKKLYKKVTRSIVKNPNLKEEEKKVLDFGVKDEALLKQNLDTYFNKVLKNEINKIIITNAKTVMISTAISQNGRLDMISVLTVNIRMIKDIVLKCGFRPSYAKLGKLSINVFSTAMIAEGLEGLDFTDLFPQSTTNFLSEIPIIKPLASSILQGISNALLTIRIGIVTRKYLFTEYKAIQKDKIRVEAIKESIKVLPSVIKDVLNFFPNQITKIFTKKKLTPEEQAIYDSINPEY